MRPSCSYLVDPAYCHLTALVIGQFLWRASMKESAVGWTYMLSARYVRRAKRLSQHSLMVVPSTLKQIAGSVQYLSHFRSSVLFRKVVGLRLFCFWPPWGVSFRQACVTPSESRC